MWNLPWKLQSLHAQDYLVNGQKWLTIRFWRLIQHKLCSQLISSVDLFPHRSYLVFQKSELISMLISFITFVITSFEIKSWSITISWEVSNLYNVMFHLSEHTKKKISDNSRKFSICKLCDKQCKGFRGGIQSYIFNRKITQSTLFHAFVTH